MGMLNACALVNQVDRPSGIAVPAASCKGCAAVACPPGGPDACDVRWLCPPGQDRRVRFTHGSTSFGALTPSLARICTKTFVCATSSQTEQAPAFLWLPSSLSSKLLRVAPACMRFQHGAAEHRYAPLPACRYDLQKLRLLTLTEPVPHAVQHPAPSSRPPPQQQESQHQTAATADDGQLVPMRADEHHGGDHDHTMVRAACLQRARVPWHVRQSTADLRPAAASIRQRIPKHTSWLSAILDKPCLTSV